MAERCLLLLVEAAATAIDADMGRMEGWLCMQPLLGLSAALAAAAADVLPSAPANALKKSPGKISGPPARPGCCVDTAAAAAAAAAGGGKWCGCA